MNYQTHDESQAGMSDSHRKLQRLKFPADLRGKRVLDLGCNEGFFCNIAAQRGAQEVIGIDYVKSNIEEARQRYDGGVIEFRHQGWKELPQGPFDLVLWTSAMHYERDPASVFNNISRILSPDGLLVLECGVAPGLTKEMVLAQRHSDTQWYPTTELLNDFLLDSFSVRQVSAPELTVGDPIPRAVFHCRKRLTTVLLLRGETQQGKTSLASLLQHSATKTIGLDLFVYRIKHGGFHHTDIQRFIRDKHDDSDLSKIYLGIDESNLTDEYASLLAEGIAPQDQLVIVEGFLTDLQAEALTRILRGRAVVWDSRRMQ